MYHFLHLSPYIIYESSSITEHTLLLPFCKWENLILIQIDNFCVHAGFRKGRRTRDQIANICWIIEKASKPVSSVTQSCPTLCDPMNRSTPGTLSITNSRSLPKLMTIESVMPSIHLILCHPLLLLPSIFPNIRVFSNESALRIRRP